jgi:vancomycin resistance protein YoaR
MLVAIFGFGQLLLKLPFLSAYAQSEPSASPKMAERIRSKFHLTSTSDITDALTERKMILKKNLLLTLRADGDGVLLTKKFALSDYPSWIIFYEKNGNVSAMLSEERIEKTVSEMLDAMHLPEGKSCEMISEWKDQTDVLRAQTTCIAKGGYIIDTKEITTKIHSALHSSEETLEITLDKNSPFVRSGTGELALLSSGRSNFEGSGLGRKANVRKALSEKVNNVLVPKDAIFSFNATLGGEVSVRNGWQNALTIFEGVNLRMAPGGGVCQASTTLYRAALRAGLPIVEQKNHSLYVHYYEAYGVGQDATIFPGKQDLKFLNDTGHPLLIQSYYEGDDATVNIYGVDDGRLVTIQGPFFASTQGQSSAFKDEKIRTGEIGWIREVKKLNASLQQDIFTARYQALPRSLPKKYTAITEVVKDGSEIVHAAAKEQK